MLALFFMLFSRCFLVKWGEILILLGVIRFFWCLGQRDLSFRKVAVSYELDQLRWILVFLSVWVIRLCLIRSMKIKMVDKFSQIFINLNLILLVFLILRFVISDYLYFYVGFECCLIPVFIIILGYGYQPERAQAGIYLIFYTLLGSFPLFILILKNQTLQGSNYMYLSLQTASSSTLFLLFLTCAFLVKFPIYGTHLWLLKAHVEAPVAGSIILAGVLLKLGGYGLIRVLPLWTNTTTILRELFIRIRLLGGIIVRIGCLRLVDIKLLIASSSVVHIRICISGLFIFTDRGVKGAILIIVAHGLCSSGLFFLANVIYERTSSRRILIAKGLLNFMPNICLWWFLLCSFNIAAPPRINLVREIELIIRLMSWRNYTIVVLAILSFFSASYRIYLFSLVLHGQYLRRKTRWSRGRLVEHLVALLHWVPLNLLVLAVYLLIYFNSLNRIIHCGCIGAKA